MNFKVVGILISTLFIVNVLTTVDIAAYDDRKIIRETTQLGNVIVVGIMDRINITEDCKEYEVHVAVIIDDGAIDIFIDEKDILRIYNPHGLEYGSIVVAFCDDWEFI